MNRSEGEARRAAVAAGDAGGIARIDTARATRAAAHQRESAAAYGREALAVDGLLAEALALHDRFVAVRDAAGVGADPSLPIHHLVSPSYVAFDRLAHTIRTHWQPTVIPVARHAAGDTPGQAS